MKDLTKFVDLASERLGGRVLVANDDFFAPKENLLKASQPVFIEGKYTSRGKWMDGWESRRRRTPGYDWCIIRLGLPGIIHGVLVDTTHFTGNYPEQCSIEACTLQANLEPARERSLLTDDATAWTEILPQSVLKGDSQNLFAVSNSQRVTHLRLKIYPDGGVARLRVYGEVIPDRRKLFGGEREIDLAAIQSGGRTLASSNEFYGSPLNLLMPGRAKNMGEGWETRRRRGPGHDWVIIKLGSSGVIRRIDVDTAHFKGNFPESCSLEGVYNESAEPPADIRWDEILPRTKLKANANHTFKKLRHSGKVSHVRFNIYPDGGVARLHIFGIAEIPRELWLDWFNLLTVAHAEAALLDCCGSHAWVRKMLASRPFISSEHLFEAADRIWSGLKPNDWREAFRHHPAIGGKAATQKQSVRSKRWSKGEQSSLEQAPSEIRAALEKANAAYQRLFGYIFIVCASGKTAEEMLAILNRRLENEPRNELHIAAEEQRKITRLRLERLLHA